MVWNSLAYNKIVLFLRSECWELVKKIYLSSVQWCLKSLCVDLGCCCIERTAVGDIFNEGTKDIVKLHWNIVPSTFARWCKFKTQWEPLGQNLLPCLLPSRRCHFSPYVESFTLYKIYASYIVLWNHKHCWTYSKPHAVKSSTCVAVWPPSVDTALSVMTVALSHMGCLCKRGTHWWPLLQAVTRLFFNTRRERVQQHSLTILLHQTEISTLAKKVTFPWFFLFSQPFYAFSVGYRKCQTLGPRPTWHVFVIWHNLT